MADRGGGEAEAWPAWRCPQHGTTLQVGSERLSCPQGHGFPIVGGVPRFVESGKYAEAFGLQWKRYRRTQLDSYTGTSISGDRARRCLGEKLWERLPGARVLEVGCGAGRFTEVLLARGAQVVSVDLSDAVEANAANFPVGGSHRIAQADVLEMPFAFQQFDVVFCLGVVQHTLNSEQTVKALYEQVRPGGSLVIDHYRYRLSWLLSLSPLWWLVFRRLSPERGLRWTERIVATLYPLHSRWRRFRLLLNRFSPVYTYFEMYPQLREDLQREWSLLGHPRRAD